MLRFEAGESFATGSTNYSFSPSEDPKLSIQVELGGTEISALVDTGAPYLVCNLELANLIGVSSLDSLGRKEIRTHNGRVRGHLYRIPVTLIATEGSSLDIEATAFVPDADQDHWLRAPTFLGFLGCLERLRFAVDPSSEKFYFGPCP